LVAVAATRVCRTTVQPVAAVYDRRAFSSEVAVDLRAAVIDRRYRLN